MPYEKLAFPTSLPMTSWPKTSGLVTSGQYPHAYITVNFRTFTPSGTRRRVQYRRVGRGKLRCPNYGHFMYVIWTSELSCIYSIYTTQLRQPAVGLRKCLAWSNRRPGIPTATCRKFNRKKPSCSHRATHHAWPFESKRVQPNQVGWGTLTFQCIFYAALALACHVASTPKKKKETRATSCTAKAMFFAQRLIHRYPHLAIKTQRNSYCLPVVRCLIIRSRQISARRSTLPRKSRLCSFHTYSR